MPHTLGPWTPGTTMRQTVGGIPRLIIPLYGEGIAVAELPLYLEDEREMVEANARLIAAAPAMLAALQAMLSTALATDDTAWTTAITRAGTVRPCDLAAAAIRLATEGA